MKVGEAIAYILGCEGVDTLIGYPVSPLIEPAAAAGIRPIIVRQERTGLHMADSMSRMTSGQADRRVHDADGAGLRERVRWRGPGVRRFRADPRPRRPATTAAR